MRRWGILGFAIAAGAGVAAYHVFWRIYAQLTEDYSSTSFILSNSETTVFFWITGIGLLITIGLTAGIASTFPNGFRIPDWSFALIPVVAAAGIVAHLFVFGGIVPKMPATLATGYLPHLHWIASPLLAGIALWLASEIARRMYGARQSSLTLLLLGTAPFFWLTSATDQPGPATAVAVLAAILGGVSESFALFAIAGVVAVICDPLASAALLLPWWVQFLRRDHSSAGVGRVVTPVFVALILVAALNSAHTGSIVDSPASMAVRASGVKVSDSTFGFGADYRPAGGVGVHSVSFGLIHDCVNLIRLNFWMLGWPFSLLLVWFAPWTTHTKMLIASVVTLLVVNVSLFHPGTTITGPPFYFVADCLLIVLAAAAIDRLPSPWTGALVIAMLAVNLAIFTPVQVRSLHAATAQFEAPRR